MFASKSDGQVYEIDKPHILPIDNKTSSHPDEHISILQLSEILLEMMKLECHLAALPVDEYKVAVVAVCLYVDNLIDGHTH